MKRIFIAAAFVALAAGTLFAGTPISTSQLPKASQTFLTKYFPSDKVRKAEQDQGKRGTEYEVDMVSGAEIEFKSDGEWKEVKAARGSVVPSGIVPSGISTYVSKNHSGQKIVEISRKRGGYEVELSNGIELKLTAEGKPYTPSKNGGGRSGGKRK